MLCDTTIPERDDGNLAGAAADVDDHVPGRLRDREPGADRCRHGLLDEIGLSRSGREGGLLDRALLDARHAGGHADDDPWVREPVLVDLLDEVTEHLLRDVEVGDDPVLQRPDRRDRARSAPEHALGLDADGVHLAGALVDRDDRGLGQHDPASTNVDEGIRGAEVDGHVAAAETGEGLEPGHEGTESTCGFAAALARAAPGATRIAPGRPTMLR